MHIVRWQEAVAQGLSWYFTGTPCMRGHVTRRRVSNRRCEACETLAVAAWTTANPEKVKAAGRRYRERYPERVREKGNRAEAKRRQKHPEKVKASVRACWNSNRARYMETQKRYAKENPEMMRTHALAYRARKHAARGAVTAAEFTAITERQKFRCHWCGNSIRSAPTMDHVIPLSKGGEHSVANVVASCRRCNSKKKDKDPIAWANELGRLF